MIYFITCPEWDGHWHKYYNKGICSEFSIRGIPYSKIIVDFKSPNISKDVKEIQRINSKEDDIWLFSMAQNPIIDLVEWKPGRKYGHIHNLGCFLFDPTVMEGIDTQEKRRLDYYDKLFFSSMWSLKSADFTYNNLTDRFVLTGFPLDYAIYEEYKSVPKDSKLIVFNQRFSWERLPQLELELGINLIKRGYRVQHLYAPLENERISNDGTLERLKSLGQLNGIEFIPNPSKEGYHKDLAKASFVITTSICDNLPVAILEAVYLGAVPIAPCSMCFPEFIHRDNLYTPYNLEEIIELVNERPVRNHNIDQYRIDKVISEYLKAMELN